MRGIFRITRAEFNKIFKKPAVYIMAVVLVLACLISLFTFTPVERTNDKVKISKESAIANYNAFTNGSDKNSKSAYDKTIENAKNEVNLVKEKTELYTTLSNLKTHIDTYYNKISSNDYSSDDIIYFKTKIYEASTYLSDKNCGDFATEYKKISVDFDKNEYTVSELSYIAELQEQITKIYNLIEYKESGTEIKNIFQSSDYLNKIYSALDKMEQYIPYTLECVVEDITNIETLFKNIFSQQAGFTTTASKDKGTRILTELYNKIAEFETITDSIITKTNRDALTTTSNKNSIKSIINRVKDITNPSNIKSSDTNSKFVDIAIQLNNDNYKSQFSSYIDILVYVDYTDTEFVSQLEKIVEKVEKNKADLLQQINSLKNDVSATKICDSITSYKLMSDSFSKLIDDSITKHNVSVLSHNEITNLDGYELSNYNVYETNNAITYNTYYLDTNTYSNQYLNTFDYGTNIDYETSAYDYIYSSLKICAFLIIIFTMMMAGYLISSEHDSGTIKLLLMRPYKRGKILIAKMLATLFFSLTFLLMGLTISVVGGIVSFGLPTLSNMLVSFNSTSIFVTSPIVMLLIYLGSVVLDIIFFLILAYFVAVVFKSFAGTLSISFISILATVVLNLSLSNSVAYKFIPFTNISLFRYFGRRVTSNEGLIATLLSTPIQSGMSFWLSLIVTVLFSIILYIITKITFRKRDY